jgi:hypothetical protein
MRVLGLVMVLGIVVTAAAGCGQRGGGGGMMGGRDSGTARVDSGPRRDGDVEDAFVPGFDGSLPDTGGVRRDGGGMFPTLGCDPACLSMSGAMCCQDCGCGGATVQCTPRCPTGFVWDCEVMCCFNRTTFECYMPAP